MRKSAIKIMTFISLLNISVCLADFLDQSAEAIESRIAPIGKVKLALETTDKPLSTPKTNHLGKALIESHCILCHGTGIAGAPRFGNKADWKFRIKKSLSLLLKHVKNGYNAMPPKGACLECSSEDLKTAIRYIIKNSS